MESQPAGKTAHTVHQLAPELADNCVTTDLHSQEGRNRPRAAPIRTYLVAIPAIPGRGDPGAAFFTADLPGGTQAYVLAVIEHATRRIPILGVTLHPAGDCTAQQAAISSWTSATRHTGPGS